MGTELEKQPGCIQTTLAIIGDKWTALILRDLYDGPQRFNQLEVSLAGISPRTLSQRLDKLEEQAIVSKVAYQQHPLRHHYQLTAKGQDLSKVIRQMADWGLRYHPDQTVLAQ